MKIVKTGEIRHPKKGEWFIEGGGSVIQALFDFELCNYEIVTVEFEIKDYKEER